MEEFIKKLKKILGEPDKFFDSVRKEDLGPAFRYYLILLLIPMVIIIIGISVLLPLILGLVALMPGISENFLTALPFLQTIGPVIGIGIGVVFYVIVLVSSFISAAILHLFVYIMGGKKGYANTYKAVAYGHTPSMLFIWLPLLNILFGLWSYFLIIKGISKLHGMTMWRAFFATLLPVIILFALLGLGLMFFTIANVTYGPGPMSSIGPIVN